MSHLSSSLNLKKSILTLAAATLAAVAVGSTSVKADLINKVPETFINKAYNKGFDDGYNGKGYAPEIDPNLDQNDSKDQYKKGYDLGLNGKTFEKAGYEAGFNKKDYDDSHVEEKFKAFYKTGYERGRKDKS
ncbi:TPA: hypothetical protein U3Q82_001157 [Streptococcus agalactiae]|uniref:Uncharacterized protein n=1 Tax=Streptococcus porcinus TaxID=1340 RepID=A0A7V9WSH7_STRPO|nr:hypothetical protein [Streptococcus porcinus]HEN0128869.1 hypothetical protein [Streptococcus agalactiae]MBA2796244.1 hypothetical protein [Streptococcus porcinus]HEN0669350.1 hypothetical protein [Streptococcus agalactiae]HEN0679270.1 hypothetical protein [Streptococcus agalactiae]HEN0765025.1 hypothetical protein [Streptococcus agalactiae]